MLEDALGIVSFHRGFLVMVLKHEKYHCFIGMTEDHPLYERNHPTSWDGMKIRGAMWSTRGGPLVKGVGLIRWIGFEMNSYDGTSFSAFDLALERSMDFIDFLCEIMDEIQGRGTSTDYDCKDSFHVGEKIASTVPQNLPKSILESKREDESILDPVSDSCFTEDGFTRAGTRARAFLSTGV